MMERFVKMFVGYLLVFFGLTVVERQIELQNKERENNGEER